MNATPRMQAVANTPVSPAEPAPGRPGPDPRVGAVVLTFNRVQEVVRTVERLLRLPEQPEIVVVDNGSRDGTADALQQRFPGVRCLRLSMNRGAAGRNAGVEACRRSYVALCDDDTWWEPGSLRRAADLLDAHPRLAVVTATVLVGEENRIDPTSRLMAASPLPASPDVPGAPLLGFLAGASMVRRSAFLAAGGFEPRFFLGAEEGLLALDFASCGWALAYVADVIVHHHPSRLRDAAARRRLIARNELWTMWLRRPLRTALAGTLHAFGRGMRNRDALVALLDAGRGAGWVLRHRRPVPDEIEALLRRLESSAGD